MSCCDDPTEPSKDEHRLLLREQTLYGNLLRDLFSDDPEKILLRQLNEANTYLREIAALNAHYTSVRQKAIQLLGKNSTAVLERIINKEPNTDIGKAAQKRVLELEK